jgi:DNA uptake protein ComE-like DNA-binding protein
MKLISLTRRSAVVAATLALVACAERTDETALPNDTTTAPAPAPGPPAAQVALFNPDSATRDQLRQVPNIDEQLADAIIAGRPFADMLAVDRILAPRLNDEQRRAIYRSVWKPIDLNTASREEILLIPDVDPRMPHEFDEYRPYSDMEQFRREIGKYVSAEEVARYERYVEIRR